jgi:hypothetical protein
LLLPLAATALTGCASFVQPDAPWANLLLIQPDMPAADLSSMLLEKATKQAPRSVKVHFANRAWAETVDNKQRGAGVTALSRGAGGGGGAQADPWAAGTTLGNALSMVENAHPRIGEKQRKRAALSMTYCSGTVDIVPADSELLKSDGFGGQVPLALRHFLMPITTGQAHARGCVTAVRVCGCAMRVRLTAFMLLPGRERWHQRPPRPPRPPHPPRPATTRA